MCARRCNTARPCQVARSSLGKPQKTLMETSSGDAPKSSACGLKHQQHALLFQEMIHRFPETCACAHKLCISAPSGCSRPSAPPESRPSGTPVCRRPLARMHIPQALPITPPRSSRAMAAPCEQPRDLAHNATSSFAASAAASSPRRTPATRPTRRLRAAARVTLMSEGA